VVFIHGAILSDGFVPVIEQTGIAEQIVHYRRRGYAGSSRALAGMTMQGWAGDCIALLNHLGIASAHVAGHSFGEGIALQMAIDAPGRVRKLALLEPPLLSLVPSGGPFTEWVASVHLRLGRQNCGHGHRAGSRVRTRLPAIKRAAWLRDPLFDDDRLNPPVARNP
jgi:pimeloyl-ACP methyl ester carboxylesterase